MVLPVLPELVHQPRVTADLVEQGVVPLLGVEVLADGREVDPDDRYTGRGEPHRRAGHQRGLARLRGR